MTKVMRILMFEAAVEDSQLLIRELIRRGYEPRARRVDTQEELRAALHEESWDVVICDPNAPAAVDAVRRAQFEGPIVKVSGTAGADVVIEEMRAVPIRTVTSIPRTTEERLRRQALVFENVHDAIVIVDLGGRIVDINPGAELLFGYSREEVRGQLPDFLSNLELTPTVLSTVAKEGSSWSGEVVVERTTAAPRVAEFVIVPLKDDTGEALGTVGVLRDVTERKQVEQQLRRRVERLRSSDNERRQRVSGLVTAQEDEAHRIASEIHDDPIQKLSAVVLRLGTLRKSPHESGESEAIAAIEKAVQDTIDRLRRLQFELSPRTLETGGLAEALRVYVQHANLEGGTFYRLRAELTEDLSVEKRGIAYSVILEALSNVRKHAAARNAVVSLTDRGGGVHCSVGDDGKGASPDDLVTSRSGHPGIASMRQKIETAGGWMEVHGLLGQGMTVEFWLPYD